MPYPIFLNIEGRRCVVVGGGRIALGKAQSLHAAGALLRVVSPEVLAEFEMLQGLELRARRFEAGDVDGAFLAVAATGDAAVNRAVAEACTSRGVLCNVVDTPERCDFFVPAVVERGALTVAISTAGNAPALARRLRQDFEEWFQEDYAEYVGFLGRAREYVREHVRDRAERERIAAELASREGYARFIRATPDEREAWLSERVAETATGDEQA